MQTPASGQLDSSEPLSAARIAEWNGRVQSFFQQDWSRLRSLIQRLEEGTWDTQNRVSPEAAALLSTLANSPAPGILTTGETPGASPSESGTADSSSVSRSPDRLSELARSIEKRMRNMNGRRPGHD